MDVISQPGSIRWCIAAHTFLALSTTLTPVVTSAGPRDPKCKAACRVLHAAPRGAAGPHAQSAGLPHEALPGGGS